MITLESEVGRFGQTVVRKLEPLSGAIGTFEKFPSGEERVFYTLPEETQTSSPFDTSSFALSRARGRVREEERIILPAQGVLIQISSFGRRNYARDISAVTDEMLKQKTPMRAWDTPLPHTSFTIDFSSKLIRNSLVEPDIMRVRYCDGDLFDCYIPAQRIKTIPVEVNFLK